MVSFDFYAEPRSLIGKGSMRRLRREGKIPAILYGVGAPEMLSLDHFKVVKLLEVEAVYSHVLRISIGDRVESAVLKAIQRHPSKPLILHMDFQRVTAGGRIRMKVPLHFVNETICIGVKKGGVVNHNITDVEVACEPDRLPEFIEVDLSAVDLGGTLHLSDLNIPLGVELPALLLGAEHNLPVVTVHQ